MDERRFEIDLANQINNKWTKDSVLGMRNKDFDFSLKIKTEDKKVLKKKFISEAGDKSDTKHNQKVIMMIYAFMIYKLIKLNKDKIESIYVCRDCGPSYLVVKYISKVCKYYGDEPITNYLKFKFRKSGKKSRAHGLVNKVLRGRRKEDYCLDKGDILEIGDMIRKNL